MAITWRNIGQSTNGGNSLIKAGSDTIARGIGALQGAAQSVADEGTRQYNTQSDINTADILSDINRFDQEDVDNFDVTALKDTYGTQYDATGIADALDARVGSLQEVAQQEAENADRALRTDNALATGALTRTNLKGQIDARAEAKAKADKFSAFSKEVNKNIGDYSSVDDLESRITKQGHKQNMSPTEVTDAINKATTTYKQVIDLQPDQVAQLAQREQNMALDTQAHVTNQLARLDKEARARGINPELAKLSTLPDTKENSTKALSELYDKSVAGEWWGEDSVKSFKSKLARKFEDAGISLPNGAELERFLTLGFENSSSFITSDGLNINAIDKPIEDYIRMRKNTGGIDTYNNSVREIEKAARKTTERQAAALKTYASTLRQNNRSAFKGERALFGEAIPAQLQDYKDPALTQSNWFSTGYTPPPPPKKRKGQMGRNN